MSTPIPNDHLHALPNGFLLEEYKIEGVLGRGGFGITYLATDNNLGDKVAIKEYLPVEYSARDNENHVSPGSVSRADNYNWGLSYFLKEAQNLCQFSHPNIVRINRFFKANGTAYLVMKYEEGQSLDSILKGGNNFEVTEDEAKRFLWPLLDGLFEMHRRKMWHRDIKPGNIYIREDGTPVLIDFGTARQEFGIHSSSLKGIVTPPYSPCEQYYSDGRQGPWTDIYALGVVMYRLVTGRVPPSSLVRMENDEYLPALRIAKGRFSDKFLGAIDNALELKPEDRPRTLHEWKAMIWNDSFSPVGEKQHQESLANRGWMAVLLVIIVIILLVIFKK
jgi:serine/threonine protein kinase